MSEHVSIQHTQKTGTMTHVDKGKKEEADSARADI